MTVDGIWSAVENELESRRRGYLASAGGGRNAGDYLVDRFTDDRLLNALLDTLP